jgi:sugar phosphate isomerase/epimerase
MQVGRAPIRLACMSLMWGQGNLPNERVRPWLNDVVQAGYEGVACFEGELLRFLRDLPFAALLQQLGLGLASVDFIIDRDFDRLRRVCEAMQSLGCRNMVLLGGLARRDADFAEIADLLNQIGEIARSFGIFVGFHNHTDHTGETLEETEHLLALTDPEKVSGFLDTGHATKDFAGHPTAERAALFLHRNWERIRFLEFKDWSPQSDLRTEVGAGEADWERIFRIVKERGYSGWITVEQNGPSGGRTPLECAVASRRFISEGLGI